MFFRKKIPSYTLTKFYFLVDLSVAIDFKYLRASVFNVCGGVPVEYSVNYGKDKKISDLYNNGDVLTFGNLEAFDCSDESGRIVFSLGRAGSAFEGSGSHVVFECFIISNESPLFQQEIGVLDNLQHVFDLQFGYVRSLPVDFSPVSEVRIKNGLFGKSVKVELVRDRWLLDPKGVNDGAVKGLYPVNFWKSTVISKLDGIGFKLSLSDRSEGIVQFSQEDLREMSRSNPSYQKFIHIN